MGQGCTDPGCNGVALATSGALELAATREELAPPEAQARRHQTCQGTVLGPALPALPGHPEHRPAGPEGHFKLGRAPFTVLDDGERHGRKAVA
jgi:hypothetical protein